MSAPRPHATDRESPEPAAAAGAPEADPVAIRACLTPDVTAVFDAEWEFVLDAAKHSKDLPVRADGSSGREELAMGAPLPVRG